MSRRTGKPSNRQDSLKVVLGKLTAGRLARLGLHCGDLAKGDWYLGEDCYTVDRGTGTCECHF
jgi:hypothetical protein